ncbi:MAG: hypothetical protein ABIW82_15640 [Dokdonella sp.]
MITVDLATAVSTGKSRSDMPYAVTGIAIAGATTGETSGAAWDEYRNLFLTSNADSPFAPCGTERTVSPSFDAALM